MEPCLTSADIAAYVSGTLPPEKRLRFEAHLQACERCRRALAQKLGNEHLVEDVQQAGHTNTLTQPHDGQTRAREEACGDASTHPDRIGPYRILEKLGQGGMGEVFLAEQTEPVRRRVALKLIKLGMDTREVVARFESERQALALMSHPNVATVHDAGTTEQGRPYFVMEFVPGTPITQYCDKHKLTVRERLELFVQACEAIQHAHQKGIIHRDIKPSNILVSVRDDKLILKVIDFGVAKAINQRLAEHSVYTEQGRLIGTPEYMSPEQAEMTSLDVDTRTDVYSLGVVLYELLVGALPFDQRFLRQAGYAEIQRIIREVEPPKPSTRISTLGDDSMKVLAQRRIDFRALQRTLRGDLDWITMKAMDKDRTRRYAGALEIASDIRRHLEHEPVVARPPSAGYRLRKFVRKNRGSVAASVAVFVVLLAGIAGTAWQAVIAQGQRDRALAAGELAKQEAERFKAVSGLLQDMIASLNPEAMQRHGGGLDAALEAAEEQLDTGFLESAPETEASVRRLLAEVAYNFNRHEVAERHLRKALSLHRIISSEHTVETIENMYFLAGALANQGRVKEATVLLTQAVDVWPDDLGANHPRLLTVEFFLAKLQGDNHMMQSVIDAYRSNSEVCRGMDGNDYSQDLSEHLARLSFMFLSLGRFDEAEPYCRRLLELDRQQYGEDHLFTAYASEWMALVLESKGSLADAERLMRHACTVKRQKLGEDVPGVGATLRHLGRVTAKMNAFDEAERTLRDALAILQRGSPEQWMRFDAMNILGGVLAERGAFVEAESLVVEGYRGVSQDPLVWAPCEHEALDRVVRFYEAWDAAEPNAGHDAEAAEWRNKRKQLEVTTEPATQPATSQSVSSPTE